MRTRSAEKKSAGKQQIAAEPAAEPAAATKRTPPSRARQVRASGSTFPSPGTLQTVLIYFILLFLFLFLFGYVSVAINV